MSESDNVGLTIVVPTLGLIISTLMFLSPLKACFLARKRGSIDSLNVIPFVFIVYNCSAWIAYGYVVDDWFIYSTNAIGFLIGVTLFVNTALLGVPNQRHRDIIYAISIVFAAWLLLMGTLERMVFEEQSVQRGRDMGEKLWGWTANIVNFLYYASPLTTIYSVVRNRDRSSLVPALCVMNTINGTFWCIYGIAIVDWFVIVPNGAGAVLGCFMTVLCIIFPNREKRRAKEAGEQDDGASSSDADATDSDKATRLTDIRTSEDVSHGGELPNLESSKSGGVMGISQGTLKAVQEEGNAVANAAPIAATAPGKGTKPEPHHAS